MSYDCHLFICTKCTTNSGSLNDGEKLQQNLKTYFKENHPEKNLRINKSGCLGKCKTGVNAVLYPQGKWFENLTIADEKILLDEVAKQ